MKKVLVLVGAVVGIVLLGVLIFMGRLGMFGKMMVEEKEIGPYTQVYESFIGPYAETGKICDKVYQALKAKGVDTTIGMGVYYDNPQLVPKDKLRSDCGVVLQEKDLGRAEELKTVFSIKTYEKQVGLVTSFPIKSPLSYVFGPMKAYPALNKLALEKGYTITGTFELYDQPNKTIFFVATFQKGN